MKFFRNHGQNNAYIMLFRAPIFELGTKKKWKLLFPPFLTCIMSSNWLFYQFRARQFYMLEKMERALTIHFLYPHNSKLFSNLNFPQNQKKHSQKTMIYSDHLFQFAQPDQQRSGIWGNSAKISQLFLQMETGEGRCNSFLKILNCVQHKKNWRW